MTNRIFQRVPEHLLNGRLNLGGADTMSAIMITSAVSEATLTGSGTQSLAESQYVSQWSASIPTLSGNAVDIGSTVVRSGVVFAVEGDSSSVTIPYPGVTPGYGILIFRDSGSTSTSPVISVDMFSTPIGLSGSTTFSYELPSEGIFDLATGLS